jgi:transaldolase
VDAGLPIVGLASVASFFVSRVDSKVDGWLEDVIRSEGPGAGVAHSLLGKIAVANAKLAYQEFLAYHASDRFVRLQENGARLQRPLWASTSTKNPAYPDTKYVEELVGPDTVNTIPPQTLDAYRDHGNPAVTIDKDLGQAAKAMMELGAIGLSIDRATRELEEEGVKAFADAYDSLIKTVGSRMG